MDYFYIPFSVPNPNLSNPFIYLFFYVRVLFTFGNNCWSCSSPLLVPLHSVISCQLKVSCRIIQNQTLKVKVSLFDSLFSYLLLYLLQVGVCTLYKMYISEKLLFRFPWSSLKNNNSVFCRYLNLNYCRRPICYLKVNCPNEVNLLQSATSSGLKTSYVSSVFLKSKISFNFMFQIP